MTICIHTYASDKFWAGVVTQCNHDQLSKPKQEQSHTPIAFLGSAFTGADLNWSTYEKEAYAIYQTFRKLDYLLMAAEDTHVFTDHRNLLFIFNPRVINPTIAQHAVSKVQRWALYLSQYQYSIEHIPGPSNEMADMLTRWTKGYRQVSKKSRIQLEDYDIVPSSADPEFVWPSLEDVAQSQENYRSDAPKNSTVSNGILYANGKLWIPKQANELQLRIIVVAHTGLAGHRGYDATLSIIKEKFTWGSLSHDSKVFVRACIHCIGSRSGDRIPRPFLNTLHASKPNELTHFDYVYLGPTPAGLTYALVIKDDFSSYVWLVPTPSASAEHAATSLARWIDVFSAMSM